jgi:TatA/E family protein of Tat protein translocase
MPQLGPLEIAVVLLIALLVFGPNRLPELAKQVGGALRELKKIQQNIRADLRDMMHDESDGAAPPPTLPPKADGTDGTDGAGGAEGGDAIAALDAGPGTNGESAPAPEAPREPAHPLPPPPDAD